MLFFGFVLGLSIKWSSSLNRDARTLKNLKADYFNANQIKYGFLSGENWSMQIEGIIEEKIDSFAFSSKNKDVLHEQISGIMNRLVDQVDELLHDKNDTFKNRMKKSAIRAFVNLDKVRDRIPEFSSIVVEEMEKSTKNKKIRKMVKEKIHKLLKHHKYGYQPEQILILEQHHFYTLTAFNSYVNKTVSKIESKQRLEGYFLIGIMCVILVFWIVLLLARAKSVYAVAFLFSVVISFFMLYTGINLPMLEIDARISELNVSIAQSDVIFYDQILFYQSKSIIEVASTLFTKGKFGSMLVGVLILVFSIVFPAVKLVCTAIYLFFKEKSGSFVRVMAFQSGKWSMADVMVVAIFISFLGFQSILSDQLSKISTSAGRYDSVNLLTTNRSNLQVGFLLFLAFVVFNLFLSMILKRITKIEREEVK